MMDSQTDYSKMKILITGSDGQLGSQFRVIHHKYDYECCFKNKTQLDIADFAGLNEYFSENDISFIVNCGAYTSVEKTELEEELAYKVNVDGVRNLSILAEKCGAKLIHLSTDAVFDGRMNRPYSEDDEVNPLSAYGKTKRLGELEMIEHSTNGIIIRTSWLYSIYGSNFVKTILRLGKGQEEIPVVNDQTGTPTYAMDLALAILEIIGRCGEAEGVRGRNRGTKVEIYHYSNEGACSWYEFAKEIVEVCDIKCKVRPTGSDKHFSSVARPKYSVLDKRKIRDKYFLKIPHWKDSLKRCLKDMPGC